MKIIYLDEIKRILTKIDPLAQIEQGFVLYSQGKATVPPVGELLMPKGEAHIKYGYIDNDDFYTIKIASGFYQNTELGLPSSNGLMLLFSQKTGEPQCILLDQGYLTDVRTAVAGAISAKWLAPKQVKTIGIIGTGIQARLQAIYLKQVTDCRNLTIWGRSTEKAELLRKELEQNGFHVSLSTTIEALASQSNLIVTTTPSTSPLLFVDMIKPGTHITAMGSDTAKKQELDAEIIANADIIVSDSTAQSEHRGEIFQARNKNYINPDQIIELGNVIANNVGRQNEQQITVADLTGVAVQDIKIAELIYNHS